MNAGHRCKTREPYGPCPPEEFAGRFDGRARLSKVLQEARYRGQAIMLSGARGSGKSSFIEWAEHEIQNEPELKGLAIKKTFPDAPGMIFATYVDLLRDLKGHQKLGWFKKTLDSPRVKGSIEVVLDALEKASPLAGPAKVGVDAGAAVTRAFLPHETVDYTQLFSSFIAALNALSDELTNEDRFLAILLDDVQWSSEPDFRLLKYLIQNPPPAIAFIITFRLEAGTMAMCAELRRELDRSGTEIPLSGMAPDEIRDFANLRYGLSVDDQAAELLHKNIGDPFCLVRCFDLLQRRNLSLSLANVREVLPDAVEPARSIYSELDQPWRDRLNSLCIIRPPLSLSLIACMLKESDMTRLQDELDQSVVFRRLKREEYDFVHSSLREYRREELPGRAAVELHSQAARCFETLRDRFDEWYADLSLAEHLFFGQEYEAALELNLRLGDRLYDLFDYRLALQLTERAKTCAEETNDRDMLAAALHQNGMILQSIYRFPDSLDFYNQSLKIAREIGNLAGEATTLHQIGMVYEGTNRFDEALDFYNQSLEIEREIGNKSGEAISLRTIEALKEEMLKKK
ncbi:MAG: tetratricopeptide repeat protein [Euryarchaeota archaeon]|nr:tetratricopeptide repeat protein [Euryarchaeota archaeon]